VICQISSNNYEYVNVINNRMLTSLNIFYITSVHSIEKCVELFVKEKKGKVLTITLSFR